MRGRRVSYEASLTVVTADTIDTNRVPPSDGRRHDEDYDADRIEPRSFRELLLIPEALGSLPQINQGV